MRLAVPILLLAALSPGKKTEAEPVLSPAIGSVDVAVIATPHELDPTRSEVRLVRVDASGMHETTLAAIEHAPGAVVRGDLVPGKRAVAVVADELRDDDWGSALYLVDGRVKLLAHNVYHASKPLASADGRIYVERGARGPELPGRMRVDPITIDAVDDAGIRTLYAWNGYTLHLAGEHAAELIVYRVGPGVAEIVAVDKTTGASRLVAEIPPYARDFSVDAGKLVMSNRDAHDARLWVVESMDLATGLRTRLTSARDEAPSAFAGAGKTAWRVPARGFRLGDRVLSPMGGGFDAVTASSSDGAWIGLFHAQTGSYDTSTVVHVASGAPFKLTTRDERVELCGIAGSKGAVR